MRAELFTFRETGLNSEIRDGADLTGGAVGETGFIVSSQVKVSGTGTFVPPSRR